MLFELFFWLKDYFSPLNVFRYVSFRTVAAMITALGMSLFLYPWFIRRLQMRQIGQVIREDGPESHFSKAGTPTMGGVLLLFAVVVSTLLWADLSNPYVGVILGITVLFGVVGFFDDYMKLRGQSSAGLSGKIRLLIEFAVAGAAMLIMFKLNAFDYSTTLYLPFVSTEKFAFELPLWIYMPFAMLVIVGTSNAVNLTDGLDGLAIGPVIVAAGTFLILAYSSATVLGYEEVVNGVTVTQKFDLAKYLMIPKVDGAQELAIFCAAMIGAGVGFLWYNSFPAQVFMGDVGALSLGGALGSLAVITKHELLSTIIFGIFLIEAISVITQTTSYKLTGKRVFRMAPIHHHFEMKGWPEPKIIVRFWIIAIVLNLVALASLKLR
ncbi:phospho-N-acetylmuramoyl-pentapeptide-transferase [Bradymonas sediminis]|uniref:Phospho-N-acetylmuramoyl-pentapeptide-transferase n=1 Tax=Bradymonas sediminis TaxID=1548548 RepID=A0A2Z4FL28_9DELT|nr:phospho-N-acetylmuramoyl-pentapeptide-transferase [Bradymonas sediminis]AWV89530.1 phospho-N-acetylmuramoyl-pentapeptide-transferase [Bradymonas sediminis]TDP76740.1 phospho-N-acetylmuramoyl-pentapeptide-transferase [Bradymonas sediminis]